VVSELVIVLKFLIRNYYLVAKVFIDLDHITLPLIEWYNDGKLPRGK